MARGLRAIQAIAMTAAVTAAGTTGAYGSAWPSIQSPRKPPATRLTMVAVRNRPDWLVARPACRCYDPGRCHLSCPRCAMDQSLQPLLDLLGRLSDEFREVREGVTKAIAEEAMRLASNKLPLKPKFVQRPGAEKTVSAESKPAA